LTSLAKTSDWLPAIFTYTSAAGSWASATAPKDLRSAS
jgi:hypothetical protein